MERPDHPVTTWRKSTYSGGNGSNCVEIADASSSLLVRDSKNREGMSLVFPPMAWRHLTATLRASSQ